MNEETRQLFVYEHDASRLELFIRIVYSIAIVIVLNVYGMIAGSTLRFFALIPILQTTG
ncbi:MAG: hypothetical protein KKD69_01135 [Euryarchaeota archaeon]|nr:hypothetical protein [Euryarchaeota archaeon]